MEQLCVRVCVCVRLCVLVLLTQRNIGKNSSQIGNSGVAELHVWDNF